MISWQEKTRTEGAWTIYQFIFYTEEVDTVLKVVKWLADLPNQGQYDSVATIDAISDCPPGATQFRVQTSIYGDELGIEFKLRFHQKAGARR